MRWWFALWLSLLGVAHAAGLPTALPGWVAWRWNTDDGLPMNGVTAVDPTPEGLLWIATYDGLARYDGDRFEVFSPGTHPVLPSARFIDVRVGSDGMVWAVSEGGALVRHRAGVFDVVPASEHGIGRIVDLVRTSEGLLVLGTEGVATLEGGGLRRWTLAPDVPFPGPLGRLFELDGAFWIAVEEEALYRRDGASDRWVRQPGTIVMPHYRSGALEGPEHRFAFTGTGGVLVVNRYGLSDSGTGVVLEHPRVDEARILRTVEGRTVVGTADGLFTWDGAALHPAPASTRLDPEEWWTAGGSLFRGEVPVIVQERPLRILAETGDGLWVADVGGGLLHVHPAPIAAVQADAAGRFGPVNSVLVDDAGGVWVGAMPGGLRRLVGGRSQPVLHGGEPITTPRSLLQLRDGAVFVSARGFACRVAAVPDAGPIDCAPIPGLSRTRVAFSSLQHSDGSVYLGWNAVVRWEPGGTEEPVFEQEVWQPIRDLQEGPDGAVYATALGGGIHRFSGGESAVRAGEEGSPLRITRTLWFGPGGDLFLGTEGKGICRLALSRAPFADAPLACASVAEGLIDGFVSAIAPDDMGRLWLSSNRGLQALPFADLVAVLDGESARVSAQGFGAADGMREPEANGVSKPAVARAPDGALWFPTMDGVARLDPGRVGLPEPPPVVLLGLDSPARALALDAPATLAEGERELRVRWTAAAVHHADDLQFRYRLAGFDTDWRGPAPTREAVWTNLPPGDYALELQSGMGGVWGPTATLATVTVPPVFTETPAFVGLLLVAGFGFMAGLLWVRTRRARAREAALEEAVDAATATLRARNEQIAAQADVLVERNARIAAQSERLAELDRARTRFVANISHELRTPLTLIQGSVEDLDSQPLEGASRQHVDLALRNARRLGHLIGQLLDTAKLDAGGVPLKARRVDLSGFLAHICGRFDGEMARREVTLVRDWPSPLPLWLDPDLMDKALTNLLANAASYTPDGGRIEVRVTAEGGDEDGHVGITVTDSGPGVPEHLQARLFERFFQADDGDQRRRGGAGIGLYLTHEIVELHGGGIGVSNAPGMGARFALTLPRGASHLGPDDISLDEGPVFAEEGAPRPARPAPAPQAAPEIDERDLPLALVVEDNADMRAYIAAHLRTAFRVVEMPNGKAALEWLTTGEARPAVVVSDVMMPELDGLGLCQRLRSMPRFADLPVMLLSAKATTQDRVAGLSLADDYLTKPFRAAEMVVRARKLAGGGGRGATEEEEAVRDPLLVKVEDIARARMADPDFNIKALAKAAALSERQLLRRIKELTGRTAAAWLRETRLAEARRQMRAGEATTVGEAAAAVGMSPAYLSRVYRDWAGHPPSDDLVRGAT